MNNAEKKAADLILKRIGKVANVSPDKISSTNPNPFATPMGQGHMIGTMCGAYRDLMQGVLLRQQAEATKKANKPKGK